MDRGWSRLTRYSEGYVENFNLLNLGSWRESDRSPFLISISILFTLIIIYSNSVILTSAKTTCYCFDDGILPDLTPQGSYRINESKDNSFLEFGHPISRKCSLALNLAYEADLSFNWSKTTTTSRRLVFLATAPDPDVREEYNGVRNEWNTVEIKNLYGEVKWILYSFQDIGYIDDICIKYDGCNVTTFNIYPIECIPKNKTLFLELLSDDAVRSAKLELMVPQEAKINATLSGFFSGANVERANGCTIFDQHSPAGTRSGQIRIWMTDIPQGSHVIEIRRLVINGIEQSPSLFKCKWELNSEDEGITAKQIQYD